MICQCKEKYSICSKPAKINLISIIPEILNKLESFLEKNNIKYKPNGNILAIDVKSPKDFFEKYAKNIEATFSQMEQDEIKVFVEKCKEELTINNVLKSKPLNLYVNYILDSPFFDILENESLTSYFQPIIDMKTKEIFAYEMLTRGVLPNGDLMYPNDLFSKSTRYNTNFKLDKLCRESALKTAAIKKVSSKIFINFIPTSIYDPEFCLKSTVKWAKQLEHDPKNIVFEVVETENIKDKEHLKKILDYYRKEGFLIALDDVGEGYSSLNMLIDIKPDIIKIDRNIIDRIDEDKMKQSVYKALQRISEENNIKLLAEGVERAQELNTLEELGVDYVQGYYFARPSAEPIREIS